MVDFLPLQDSNGGSGREGPLCMESERRVALAIAAHPDDIEFGMVGTLMCLGEVGYELHYLNLASGSCGSTTKSAEEIRKIRSREAQSAAAFIGATWYPPLVDDLEIFYNDETVRRLGSVVREISPSLVLTHSPQDYMEDHTNTCRLSVTALFSRGMRNFRTQPERSPVGGKVTLYHAMPHGLCDPLARPIRPELFVDTSELVGRKRSALECHASQKEWLDESQGMDSYVGSMLRMSAALGEMSGRFLHAEGWRRHLHFGFCDAEDDPLREHLDERAFVPPVPVGEQRFYVA